VDLTMPLVENKYVFIENGNEFEKYDFTGFYLTNDGTIKKGNIEYEIEYSPSGCINVTEAYAGEIINECYLAGTNFVNKAELANLAQAESEKLRKDMARSTNLNKDFDRNEQYNDFNYDNFNDFLEDNDFEFKPSTDSSAYYLWDGDDVIGQDYLLNGVLKIDEGEYKGMTIYLEGDGVIESVDFGFGQGLTKDKEGNLVSSASTNGIISNFLYEAAWDLTNHYVGKWSDAAVESMCRAEYEARVPLAKSTKSTQVSGGPRGNAFTQNCEGHDVTMVTTQIIDKFQCLNEVYKYNVMYTIASCHDAINYTLSLESCNEQGCNPTEIRSGNLDKGGKIATEITHTDQRDFNYACLKTSDTRKLCVPYTSTTLKLNDDCESLYVPPVVETCEDAFDIYITKNGNNYEYIYGVKQCEASSYSVALMNSNMLTQEGLLDMGYGDSTESGVKTSEEEFSIACLESASKRICKNFNNLATTLEDAEEESLETQFSHTISKIPEQGFFTYDVKYNIITFKTLNYETYLVSGNNKKVIETNTISSAYEFEDLFAESSYDEFCIETDDPDFADNGIECFDI
ncbi:hypothetical protein KY321_05730, partial [Candidatus Woesearchaeota archaeon]|nr:hypothetical protein [Candidatus Woesearchaeota archaeon]